MKYDIEDTANVNSSLVNSSNADGPTFCPYPIWGFLEGNPSQHSKLGILL